MSTFVVFFGKYKETVAFLIQKHKIRARNNHYEIIFYKFEKSATYFLRCTKNVDLVKLDLTVNVSPLLSLLRHESGLAFIFLLLFEIIIIIITIIIIIIIITL